MISMREKMARSHFQKSYSGFGPSGPPPGHWEKVDQDTRDFFLEIADAHLNDLLEPTEGMVEACMDMGQVRMCDLECQERFKVMIRAAKEGK